MRYLINRLAWPISPIGVELGPGSVFNCRANGSQYQGNAGRSICRGLTRHKDSKSNSETQRNLGEQRGINGKSVLGKSEWQHAAEFSEGSGRDTRFDARCWGRTGSVG